MFPYLEQTFLLHGLKRLVFDNIFVFFCLFLLFLVSFSFLFLRTDETTFPTFPTIPTFPTLPTISGRRHRRVRAGSIAVTPSPFHGRRQPTHGSVHSHRPVLCGAGPLEVCARAAYDTGRHQGGNSFGNLNAFVPGFVFFSTFPQFLSTFHAFWGGLQVFHGVPVQL